MNVQIGRPETKIRNDNQDGEPERMVKKDRQKRPTERGARKDRWKGCQKGKDYQTGSLESTVRKDLPERASRK